ncbi:hypothetical protein Dvina_29450 [Dactylosporangium vinaceum]|uniref:DUF6461 domain-containing protein n=1 Tax=Dactylosporangium vinaceum TaxID=53362 RepID=A0ABV5MEU0_9ACTN|nr:DUF6461 domain-containing protein [Dactylosporangium vinaceum]UAB92473.1 hypothetical protein Dvina_29450 [Dactylosporangium vinaceum]
MTTGLEQASALCDALGEIFCLTFVRGVDAREALLRFGAYPDTFAELDLEAMEERRESYAEGYPAMAGAISHGEWAVVLEPSGFEGTGSLLEAVSAGTEAVAALRHDYASPRFAYAVDGTEIAGFDPEWPQRTWGADPDRLLDRRRAAGLEPAGPDDPSPDEAVARAVLLAAGIAGGLPAQQRMTAPMLAAQIEPWFTTARPSGGTIRADHTDREPHRAALVAAVDAATPAAKRAVAVAEARRIAALLGVADTPGLADVLTAAESGHFPGVPLDSPLGRAVRGWLRLATTAGNSLNDHAGRRRMTDAERRRGYRFGWFTSVLRAALYPDPDTAVRTALYALGSGPAPLHDPTAVAEVLTRLRA